MVFVVAVEPWEQRAAEFCVEAHKNQTDKGGKPYFDHPWRVASKVRHAAGTQAQITAAYLHDVLEDTDVLDVEEFGDEVADIVDALTHRKGETNVDYYRRIRATPAAVLVKLCDIYDNLDPQRMARLDEKTQARLISKYGVALGVLYD